VSGLMRMEDTFSVRKEVGTHTTSDSFSGKVHYGRIAHVTGCTVHKHVLPASEAVRTAVRLSETVMGFEPCLHEKTGKDEWKGAIRPGQRSLLPIIHTLDIWTPGQSTCPAPRTVLIPTSRSWGGAGSHRR
jgi:hypothetical protein